VFDDDAVMDDMCVVRPVCYLYCAVHVHYTKIWAA